MACQWNDMHRNLHACIFLVFVYISLVLGQNPEHAVTALGRDLPKNLFFFPNSTVSEMASFWDDIQSEYQSAIRYGVPERVLYVSHDTGKSWTRERSMPPGLVDEVILHPFNERMVRFLYHAPFESSTRRYRLFY
jgi:hypothetical protein